MRRSTAALGSYITNNYGVADTSGLFADDVHPDRCADAGAIERAEQQQDRVQERAVLGWHLPDRAVDRARQLFDRSGQLPYRVADLSDASRYQLKDKTPDIAGAGVLAAAGGAQFGYSTNRAPTTITGHSRAVDAA